MGPISDRLMIRLGGLILSVSATMMSWLTHINHVAH